MRRPVASFLLVLFFAWFALPLVQAQTTAPACCRRGGQHHCTAPSTTDGFRSLADCCSYRHLGAAAAHGNPALGQSSGDSFNVVSAPNPGTAFSAPVVKLFAHSNSQ